MIITIPSDRAKINIKSVAIDTNVLLWTFYDKTTFVQSYQKKIYPGFLSGLIENRNCKVYTTFYNICELFNVIENNEYELYLKHNSLEIEVFSKKQYRLITEEREKLKKTFELLYSQISQCMEIKEMLLDENCINFYNENFLEHRYDMFDFLLLKFCKDNNVDGVVTDDSDFSSYKEYVNNVSIITANRNLK